ncbi:tetratricopeptide repeat protein [Streptomyces griseofuscus]|uniref:tetratricopeptide repeat protein n=1 Tax=Streptomyces griseofuscus TaxID=146922 RepID=UPI0033C43D22
MVRARPSMQELIGRRRRAGFIGRGGERAAFRENLDLPPEDERHRFLFHIHGQAGVGKTFLVRELEQTARERGALTAYVDEGVGSVPEALSALSREFARQDVEFKKLDRALTSYRERRHEAEAVAAGLDSTPPDGPSPGTATAVRAGLAGLGLIPGAGPFVGAVDPAQVAQAADRLKRGLSAKFGSQDDVQLVLSPERALTPKLLDELESAASTVPWIVLFFDTYERTGPFLDHWLHDLMTTDRYGALPADVIVVTAGQQPFDRARWGGFADFMTEIPLGPFTEAETRGLLADRGVVAEPVVTEVLRLTGGLPLLVSTLAEQRPADLEDVGDPSATAVERFLKWEQDPARRAVALACALPRSLDLDVFRAVVDAPESDALFGWLSGLPFVDDRRDRLRYHDLVRETMLRLLRRRSPQQWRERHEVLAAAYGGWCEEAAEGVRPDALWEEKRWRALRLEQTYHLLCARRGTELAMALARVVQACTWEQAEGRRWARMLEEAGTAADDTAVRDWGRRLREALADDQQGLGTVADLLSSRPGPDLTVRALAYGLLGKHLVRRGEDAPGLAAFDQGLALGERAGLPQLELARLHYGRAIAHQTLENFTAAMTDLDRADALWPDTVEILWERGETQRLAGRPEEAVTEFERALALDPAHADSLACRAVCRHALGHLDEALADFDRALDIAENDLWTLVRRSHLCRDTGEWEEAFADLDRAFALAPDVAWIASERGDAYRLAHRYEEAVAELGRAVELKPDYASALASRGAVHFELRRAEEAFADLDRAIALVPDYGWALGRRARAALVVGRTERALADLDRCVALDAAANWARGRAVDLLMRCGRWTEALDRLAEADRLAVPDLEEERAEAHRHARQWAAAMREAERLVLREPLDGTICLALAVGGCEGQEAARPLWRAAEQLLPRADLDSSARAYTRCFLACALGDWPTADAVLTHILAEKHDWDDLALLAALLTELLTTPGTDRLRLAPRLAAVESARDAIQARYAE